MLVGVADPPPSLSHMSYSYIAFNSDSDGIAELRINRPDKLNALNTATVSELEEAIRKASADASIRGLIVTGAGEKAFVAGADINELAVLSPVEARSYGARGQQIGRASCRERV